MDRIGGRAPWVLGESHEVRLLRRLSGIAALLLGLLTVAGALLRPVAREFSVPPPLSSLEQESLDLPDGDRALLAELLLGDLE
jgi:hypothetical protein